MVCVAWFGVMVLAWDVLGTFFYERRFVMDCEHVVITGERSVMMGILYENTGGGSYWLTPFDC